MGGMLILISLFFSIILWGDLSSNLFWLVFSITILFGLIEHAMIIKSLNQTLQRELTGL